LSISTLHGQPVAQHAMLRNTIDHEWSPLVTAASGRFHRFKIYNNLHNFRLTGMAVSADEVATTKFPPELIITR
jgi:hypothetical protein